MSRTPVVVAFALATAVGLSPLAARAADGEANPLHVIGFLSVGAASTALVSAVPTGLLAMSRASSLASRCKENHCKPSLQSAMDDYERLQTLVWVDVAVVLGVGVKGSLFLLHSKGPYVGASERPWSLVLIGAGVAGLGLGAGTGGMALSARAELEDKCPRGLCPSTERSLVGSYRTLGTMSVIQLSAGATALAGGIFLAGRPKRRTWGSVEPYFGPGIAGIQGGFQ